MPSSKRIVAQSTALTRRAVLRSLAMYVPAAWILTACGGGGSDGAGAPPPPNAAGQTPKPLATLVRHGAGGSAAQEAALASTEQGVASGSDRFLSKDAFCHVFAGVASQATVSAIPPVGGARFALSGWIQTRTLQPMKLLSIRFADGGQGWQVSMNGEGMLTLAIDGNEAALSSPDLRDDRWHHLLIQALPTGVELCVDGVYSTALAMDSMPSVGPSELRLGMQSWTGSLDDLRLHDRIFNAIERQALVYEWRSVKASQRADSIAGFYPFNGNALNATGRGSDGIVNNATLTTDRHGNPATAYRFNGDGGIQLNDAFDAVDDDYAFAFWLKSESASEMVALEVRSPGSTLTFVANRNSAIAVVQEDAGVQILSAGRSGELTDGRWHFVLFQRVGAGTELYVDGELRGQAGPAPSVFGPGSQVSIGRSASPPLAWQGSLDDVQIYVRSFTTEQARELESFQFLPKDGVGALHFAGRLWLLGGWNPDHIPVTDSEVWASDDGKNWKFVANAPWEGRHTAGWAVFAGRMWVVGGDKNRGHYQNDVWSTADGVNWDKVTDAVPWAGRATHMVASFKDRLWLLGGQQLFEESGSTVVFNDVYSSTDGRDWKLETAHAPWTPRGLVIGSAVHAGKLWVIGGGTYTVRSFNNDVWCSSNGVDWEQVAANAPWTPRQYHNVAAFDGKLWVIAGGTQDAQGGTNEVWLSGDGRTWWQLPDTPWAARHAAAVVAHDRQLWLIGGSSTRLYNDVWCLTYAR